MNFQDAACQHMVGTEFLDRDVQVVQHYSELVVHIVGNPTGYRAHYFEAMRLFEAINVVTHIPGVFSSVP